MTNQSINDIIKTQRTKEITKMMNFKFAVMNSTLGIAVSYHHTRAEAVKHAKAMNKITYSESQRKPWTVVKVD